MPEPFLKVNSISLADKVRAFLSRNPQASVNGAYDRLNPPPGPSMKGWFDTTPVSRRNPLRPVQVYDPAIGTSVDERYAGPVGKLRRTFSRGPGTTSYDTSRYRPNGQGDYVLVFGGAGTGTGGVAEDSIDPDTAYGKGNYAAFTWRQVPEAMKFVESLPKGSRLHVFGHSMGATAAMDFARRAGARGIGIAGMDLRDAVRINGRLRALVGAMNGTRDRASVPSNVSRASHRYNAGWLNNVNPFGRRFTHTDAVSLVGQRWNEIDGAYNMPSPKGEDHKMIGNAWKESNPVFPVREGWRRDSGRSSLWRAVNGVRQ